MSGKSTNEPFRKTALSKRKQADEEYQLIKELSQSIANKNKRKRAERKNDTIFEAFGNYVAKALSELDSQTSNLAQNKISNIIFQAQAGLLTQEMQIQTTMQAQPKRNYFHPILQPDTSKSPQPHTYGHSSYRDDY